MDHLDDIEIKRTPETAAPPLDRSGAWWAIGGLLVAALAAVYVLLIWNRDTPAETAADQSAVTATTVDAKPVGDAIDVPPLDQTDPLVRQLLGALSSHPRLAAWLATDGLVRGFTVVVDTIASGTTPSAHLAVLTPAGTFSATDSGEDTRIDPASYSRYDSLADAFASLDPAGVARVYATLEPRIDEAYRERFIGDPFNARLERAIVLLLATPSLSGEVALRPSGIGYAYADPELEALSGAQKHLLRMGPRNAGIVKSRLREIALALGIAEERLPRQPR